MRLLDDVYLIDVQTSADLLGCGRSKVFELIRSGVLPSVRVGKKRMIPSQAIAAYLAERLNV